MAELELNDLREVLRRAEEIERQSATSGPTHDALIAAAEEAGLSRESVVRALQERIGVRKPVAIGDWVFARSSDRRFYPAEVTEVLEWGYAVHFATGGQLSVPSEAVKPLEILPGSKVEVPWPAWGWYNAAVVSFDHRTQVVSASDGMSTKTFPLAQCRLRPDLTDRQKMRQAWLAYLAVGVGSFLLGLLVMYLRMR